MPAYAIVCYRTIRDPAKLREYSKLAGPTLRSFGAVPRAANTPGINLEGAETSNVVVLEFPDLDTARAWYESPAYQEAAAIRREAADADFLLVEGLPIRP